MNIVRWILLCILPFFILTARDLPILMYHAINNKKDRYSVTPEAFRSHLEKLYEAGYVTAPLRDVLAKKPHLKNKKIVILRFDGAKLSQFNYIKDKKGKLQIDPNCAVGIMLDFYKQHPSFGKNAFFCLLPQGFEQPEYEKKKLNFLLAQGMELVNHGDKHIDLTKSQPAAVDNEFGKGMDHWNKILGPACARKNIRSLATPFGAVPKRTETKERLRNFSYKGISYPQEAIFYAGYGYNHVAPCPFSPAFDPYDLPSIEITMKNFDEKLASFNK